jgi:hypothetical protein
VATEFAGGKLIERLLTGGEAHDMVVAAELTEDIVERTMIADSGYDSDGFQRKLANSVKPLFAAVLLRNIAVSPVFNRSNERMRWWRESLAALTPR